MLDAQGTRKLFFASIAKKVFRFDSCVLVSALVLAVGASVRGRIDMARSKLERWLEMEGHGASVRVQRAAGISRPTLALYAAATPSEIPGMRVARAISRATGLSVADLLRLTPGERR